MLSIFSLATNLRRRFTAPPTGSQELDANAVQSSTDQQVLAEMIEPDSASEQPLDSPLSVNAIGHGGSMIDRPDVIRAVAIVMLSINLISLIGFWRLYNRKSDEMLRGPLQFITDVNSAPASELSLLPGIGYELANRIVVDRETAGPYRSIDDLERVRGIGPKTIAQIKSMIVFDSGPQSP